jgi:hypothetical protein
MLTECKTNERQNKLQQLQWKEQEKEEDKVKERDECEDDLNIMGRKNRQAMIRQLRKWRKFVLEAKVHNGL